MNLHTINKKERNMLIDKLADIVNDTDLVNTAILETIHNQYVNEHNIFRTLLIATSLNKDTVINILMTTTLYDDYIYPNMHSLYKIFRMKVTKPFNTVSIELVKL